MSEDGFRLLRQKYTAKDGTTRQSSKWYVELKDHQGTRRRFPGYTDKKLTAVLGRKLKRLADMRALGEPVDAELGRWLESLPSSLRERLAKTGLLDSKALAHSRPLSDHLTEFYQSLLDKGDTGDHATTVTKRAKAVMAGCEFLFFADISASKVQRNLANLRKGSKAKRSISHQTSNFYQQAVKQFCRWMVRDGRASESPVEHLSGVKVELDRRHERRSLTEEELRRLLVATLAGPVRHRLTGFERAMLYRVAMETGLRRNELWSLTPSSLEFESEIPVIAVHPADVKNRKPTSQVVRRELADELTRWVQQDGQGPGEPLWRHQTANTAMMLRKDLTAAEIPYVDDSGRYADFHALRHSYVSLITRGGVHPKIAQSLARQSN